MMAETPVVNGVTIAHPSLRCPGCNSLNVKIRSMKKRKHGNVRYVLCYNCFLPFKTLEVRDEGEDQNTK
jgi:transcription elongation factor Elf1